MRFGMRWIKNSLSLAKYSAVSVAALTMVISPVAQGAGAKAAAKEKAKPKVQSVASNGVNYNVNKKNVLEYLKKMGLHNRKKPISVGEFYSNLRGYLPKKLQRDMDYWVRLNRNELMPEFQVSTYKDSDGKEQVRLLISKGGQTTTISFNPENNAKFAKFNNVYLTKDDFLYHDQMISKLIYGDKAFKNSALKAQKLTPLKQTVMLSYEEFNRLSTRQRAEYLVRLRFVIENAQRVMKAFYGQQALNDFNKEFFAKWFLGSEAEAADKTVRGAKVGDPCIVAGYISAYGENFSCGGNASGAADLKKKEKIYGGVGCPSNTQSCNPLVYGFKSGNPPGRPYCVSRANVKGSLRDATSTFCHQLASPLRKGSKFEGQDKEAIIESWMAAQGTPIDLHFDKEGKIPQAEFEAVEGYLKEMNGYIDKAIETCQTVPLIKIKEVRDEQASACEAIATRKMDLLGYPSGPAVLPPPVPPAPVGEDCSKKPGSQKDESGACVCPLGTGLDMIREESNNDTPACVPIPPIVPPTEDEPKKECNKGEDRDKKTGECVAGGCTKWWCSWKLWGAVGGVLAVGGLIWALGGDDDKDKDKQKPYDPCPPVGPCMPNPPPVANPVPVTDPPPITTDPTPVDTVPTPMVTPYVESTSGSSSSSSGGVR